MRSKVTSAWQAFAFSSASSASLCSCADLGAATLTAILPWRPKGNISINNYGSTFFPLHLTSELLTAELRLRIAQAEVHDGVCYGANIIPSCDVPLVLSNVQRNDAVPYQVVLSALTSSTYGCCIGSAQKEHTSCPISRKPYILRSGERS